MADISQVKLPGDSTAKYIKAPKLFYGTCGTAAATAAKTVTVKVDNGASGNNAPFVLETGSTIVVKFTVTNTAAVANLTLSVNGSTAKNIKYRNANLSSAGVLAANRYYLMMYDGTYWQIIGDLDTDIDNKVNQAQSTTSDVRPLIMGYQNYSTVADMNTGMSTASNNSVYKAADLYAQASTGTLGAKVFSINQGAKIQFNSTDNSIEFIFN